MREIFIDGDACPVKQEAMDVASRHGWKVWLVSNAWLRMQTPPHVEKVVVSDGFDAADDWIVEKAGEGDVVITADIPLASRSIKKGAAAIGPTGKLFTTANIGTVLAMRDLNAHLRTTGEISGFNASFSKTDRSRFLQGLEDTIQKIKRGKPI